MAKPITRFARQLANKLGYDLLRLQKIHIYDEAFSGLGRGGGFDAFEAIVPRDIKSVDIFLRSCAGIEVHGQERGRFNGAPKSEVLFRCLRSLVSSINLIKFGHRTLMRSSIKAVSQQHTCAGRAQLRSQTALATSTPASSHEVSIL